MHALTNSVNSVLQNPTINAAYSQYDQLCLNHIGKDGKTVGKIAALSMATFMVIGLINMSPAGPGAGLIFHSLPSCAFNLFMGYGDILKMFLGIIFQDLLGGAVTVLGSAVGVVFKGTVTATCLAMVFFSYKGYCATNRVAAFFNAPPPALLPPVAPAAPGAPGAAPAPAGGVAPPPPPVNNPYPPGPLSIHHVKYYYVEAKDMAQNVYQNGIQGTQFVRGQMANKPAVRYGVYAVLGTTAATYIIAMAAIGLTIASGLIRATLNFTGTVIYSGYTFVKGVVQSIYYCSKAVLKGAYDVMAVFWNAIKAPLCMARDGVYMVGSATYNALKPVGVTIIHGGKVVGSKIYSLGVSLKDGTFSLAGRVSSYVGPKAQELSQFIHSYLEKWTAAPALIADKPIVT